MLLLPTDPEASYDAMAINLASLLRDDTCIMPVNHPIIPILCFMLSCTYYAGNYAGLIDASLKPVLYNGQLLPGKCTFPKASSNS